MPIISPDNNIRLKKKTQTSPLRHKGLKIRNTEIHKRQADNPTVTEGERRLCIDRRLIVKREA